MLWVLLVRTSVLKTLRTCLVQADRRKLVLQDWSYIQARKLLLGHAVLGDGIIHNARPLPRNDEDDGVEGDEALLGTESSIYHRHYCSCKPSPTHEPVN